MLSVNVCFHSENSFVTKRTYLDPLLNVGLAGLLHRLSLTVVAPKCRFSKPRGALCK